MTLTPHQSHNHTLSTNSVQLAVNSSFVDSTSSSKNTLLVLFCCGQLLGRDPALRLPCARTHYLCDGTRTMLQYILQHLNRAPKADSQPLAVTTMSGYVVVSLGAQLRSDREQLWKVEGSADDRKVTYLSTLAKHTQAVNVVRWCPRGR